MAVSAKTPDIARFSPIRADSTAIFYACHPNSRATDPIASEFSTKLNDCRFACLTLGRDRTIVKNRVEIGSLRSQIGPDRAAIVRKRAHIALNRVISGHIGPLGENHGSLSPPTLYEYPYFI
jgi:hypothetical protein